MKKVMIEVLAHEHDYVKHETISLKLHSDFNEKWVQDRIADDPSILGLGKLVLREKERIQPRAGRLDLLLQDPESNRRYEIEIQLGATDETHIIRTIEYWDIDGSDTQRGRGARPTAQPRATLQVSQVQLWRSSRARIGFQRFRKFAAKPVNSLFYAAGLVQDNERKKESSYNNHPGHERHKLELPFPQFHWKPPTQDIQT